MSGVCVKVQNVFVFSLCKESQMKSFPLLDTENGPKLVLTTCCSRDEQQSILQMRSFQHSKAYS